MAITTNKNFLSPAGFKFKLNRSPNIEYFVQSANIPSLTMGASNFETPFVRLPVPGDKLIFSELNITFRVDEDLKNYIELYDWLIALGFPESFDQFTLNTNRTTTALNETTVSDATLLVLTNTMNPNYEIKYRDIYPYALSELRFDTMVSDIDYIECTASFFYKDFTITKL